MPTRPGRRLAALTLAALLASGAALTGCADDGEPAPTSSPTATASSTPTPSQTPESPEPPTRPAAMATNDEAGALAAAQYFGVDLYAYAFATGDLAEWRAMSDPSCGFCNGVIQNVEQMQAAGELDRGQVALVESAYGSTITEGTRYTATIVVQQPASTVEDASGAVTGQREAQRYELYFAIAWQDGWRMLAVDATAVEG